MFRSRKKIILGIIALVSLSGLCIPQRFVNPVANAAPDDFNQKSFWYSPWGKSGTHKGVDIFAPVGTMVNASTSGIVVYAGEFSAGGNVIFILGPKWRLHYYAHLKEINTSMLEWKSMGEKIGSVGTSGNAMGKQPHLHYSISTLIPYLWRIDRTRQGWKKMFYLNPIDYLNQSFSDSTAFQHP
jgi:peptidoglycan LD-endopeptidase LytH